jgi:hypothetical protein
VNLPDIINGCFEFLGGCLVWMNCQRLYRDKEVKGVYLPATAIFGAWGLWNLFYYPHLGQWASFTGGVVLVLGNLTWVAMALHYCRPKPLRVPTASPHYARSSLFAGRRLSDIAPS